LDLAIERYLEINNRKPKPFEWTKQPDQILAGAAPFVNEFLTRNTAMKRTPVKEEMQPVSYYLEFGGIIKGSFRWIDFICEIRVSRTRNSRQRRNDNAKKIFMVE
jgi:hypothetical protein